MGLVKVRLNLIFESVLTNLYLVTKTGIDCQDSLLFLQFNRTVQLNNEYFWNWLVGMFLQWTEPFRTLNSKPKKKKKYRLPRSWNAGIYKCQLDLGFANHECANTKQK